MSEAIEAGVSRVEPRAALVPVDDNVPSVDAAEPAALFHVKQGLSRPPRPVRRGGHPR
ncbi:hypothetical protein GCM10017673_09970 [Streptosporangium violaceochromogenes]|nr:hypothetical protein GCM10017673_09970 [Streptosporangium violaceochromogenes]